MVIVNEYVFDNIDDALNYVLDTEQRGLSQNPAIAWAIERCPHVSEYGMRYVISVHMECMEIKKICYANS